MELSSPIFILFLGNNFPSSQNKKPTLKKFLYFEETELSSSKLKNFLYFRKELAGPENQKKYYFSNISAKEKSFLYFSS